MLELLTWAFTIGLAPLAVHLAIRLFEIAVGRHHFAPHPSWASTRFDPAGHSRVGLRSAPSYLGNRPHRAR